jgi:hypothetical protein
MKKLVLPLTLFGLLSVASADALRDQIKVINDSSSLAIQNKDMVAFAKALKPYVSKDFTYSEPGGKPMGFDKMVEGMKMGLAGFSRVRSAEAHYLTIKTNGKESVVSSVHKIVGLIPGKGKRPHVMSYKGLSKDIYRLEGGKYKLVSMTMSTSEVTYDGKPMAAPSSTGK